MIRQFITAAAPAARLASPTSVATLKSQASRQSTWLYANSTPLSLRSSRLFSSTIPTPFASSAVQNASPFRLSTDKHKPFEYPEEDPYNAYKPKRQWPPDMSKLSPKHQFRLERKYRRRAALKYARPKFIKMVTLTQWIIIGFVAIYAVLFMNWDTKDTPFDGIREGVFSGISAVFSSPPPPGPVKRADGNNGAESQNGK
ncbi:hypothetical protein N7462_007521 [Penicillium macrosclerotiorum]|uniref:uncharacterized protein n=1 Tax=Penicillium macrosclerotiorum TaxID=303699 RepID=UPI002548FB84|nr:uncharacterized protein N7462_007521 [Penicillium macrosclerotiorum]KAJ5679277.1 hypothetical protein N7462_007521 [Penicillium macrosclerotiorum]